MKVQNYCIKNGTRLSFNELSFSGVYRLGKDSIEDSVLHADIQSALGKIFPYEEKWMNYLNKNIWSNYNKKDVFLFSGYSSNVKDEISELLLAVIDIIQFSPMEYRAKIINSNFSIQALTMDEIKESSKAVDISLFAMTS